MIEPARGPEGTLSREIEIRFRYASRRYFRRSNLDGGGAALCALLRRGVGHGRGGGPLRRDSGGFFHGAVRRYANRHFRSRVFHDRRHGGHRHHPRDEPQRSPGHRRSGRSAASASGRPGGRALRGLHALRGRLGLHVRHRRHHHDDRGPALSRRTACARRIHGRGSRTTRGVGRVQRRRLWRRRRHARRLRVLASPLREISARSPGGARRRRASGRDVAERCAHHRADAGRSAGIGAGSALPPASWRGGPYSRRSFSPYWAP